jgi:GNAT superfamily N-acetyltransferase
LLQRGEAFLASHQVREVTVCDYTPNYIVPGVDVDGSASGYAFLKAHGYSGMLKVYGMGRSLLDVTTPPDLSGIRRRLAASGLSVSLFSPQYALLLLEFLRQYYPGDLFRVALDRLTEDPECDEILVATKDGDVVGFSHFRDERFGPFGIHPGFGGRGLGPLLYYATVEQMRKKGKHNLWLAWTTGHAKDFYHRMGLRVLRRHIIMRKTL